MAKKRKDARQSHTAQSNNKHHTRQAEHTHNKALLSNGQGKTRQDRSQVKSSQTYLMLIRTRAKTIFSLEFYGQLSYPCKRAHTHACTCVHARPESESCFVCGNQWC